MQTEIDTASITPADRLALRCAIASLELLKTAAKDLMVPIEQLDAVVLLKWLQQQDKPCESVL
jgi:hypothetical protein